MNNYYLKMGYDPSIGYTYNTLTGKEHEKRVETIKWLHYDCDISAKKLAEYMECSVGTIYSMLNFDIDIHKETT